MSETNDKIKHLSLREPLAVYDCMALGTTYNGEEDNSKKEASDSFVQAASLYCFEKSQAPEEEGPFDRMNTFDLEEEVDAEGFEDKAPDLVVRMKMVGTNFHFCFYPDKVRIDIPCKDSS